MAVIQTHLRKPRRVPKALGAAESSEFSGETEELRGGASKEASSTAHATAAGRPVSFRRSLSAQGRISVRKAPAAQAAAPASSRASSRSPSPLAHDEEHKFHRL